MKRRSVSPGSSAVRFRVLFSDRVALGPGKAELLRQVRNTGSISTAAKRMRMSYMRAWSLVQEMNRCFRAPVIDAARGGNSRGGAQLTATGERLVELFQRMEAECLAASKTTRREITSLLRRRS